MAEIRKTGQKIAENFHTEAVITGIDLYTKSADKEAEMANLIVNKSTWEWVTAKKEGGSYSGTGDLFASVLSLSLIHIYGKTCNLVSLIRNHKKVFAIDVYKRQR